MTPHGSPVADRASDASSLLPVSLGSLVLILFGIDVLLLALHLVITVWHLVGGRVLAAMFDLDAEQNVPTWWSSMLWASVAMAAYACYVKDRGRRFAITSRLWLLLAGVFLFASMDETATIHEEVGSFLEKRVQAHGWLLNFPVPDSPWIVFYAPFLALFFIGFLWFVSRKFAAHRYLIWLVVGGLGCHALSIVMDYYQGLPTPTEEVIAHVFRSHAGPILAASIAAEETLENFGTTLLFAAFASYAIADSGASRSGPPTT